MPAHRVRHATGALIDQYVPWPSTIIGLILVAILLLAVAGLGWAPAPGQPTGPVPSVAITPDDPAAPTPVPVQELER